MKKTKFIVSSLIALLFIFPTVSSATSSQSFSEPVIDMEKNPDLSFYEANIAPDAITVYNQHIANVRDTYWQNLSDGKWFDLYDITYKEVWFTNGITKTDYVLIQKIDNWWSNTIKHQFQDIYRIW